MCEAGGQTLCMMRSGRILSIPIMSPRFRQAPDMSSIPDRESNLVIQYGGTRACWLFDVAVCCTIRLRLLCMMAGPEAECRRRGYCGDPWARFCAAVAGDGGQRSQGGGLWARSLRNCDARDSDARHLADGHLEQEIQHLEGLAVPTCQRSGGVHSVIFSVGLNR